MSKNVVELGDEVKCTVTGFQGVTTGKSECLQGVTRFDVQPPVNSKGEVPDAYTIDVTNLKVIKKHKVEAQPPGDSHGVSLGDEVEDTLSKFKGVVTITSLSLNGCYRVGVQPKIDKDGALPKQQGFDVGRLKVTKAAKVPEGQHRTGGPMERTQCI